MKKIGIINFHFAYNYGAALQCVALAKYLEMENYQVEVINYQPSSIRDAYPLYIKPLKEAIESFRMGKRDRFDTLRLCNRFIQNVRWNLDYWYRIEKKKQFDAFVSDNLVCTETYLKIEDLLIKPPLDDVYIAGSDQIWNKNNTGGKFDSAYFLEFGNRNTKRIVYGASVGNRPTEQDIAYIVEHMKDLNAVSVREKSLVDKLVSGGCTFVKHVCDPVFLLEKDMWKTMIPNAEKKDKFILVYCFEQTNEFVKYVNEIRKRNKCKVIDISPYTRILGSHHDKKCGPRKFLEYFYKADYVITDSFHGTSFSIIFEKKFVTFLRRDTSSRMEDLLDELGLRQRIYLNNSDRLEEDIDYQEVNAKKEKLIYASKEFVKNNL